MAAPTVLTLTGQRLFGTEDNGETVFGDIATAQGVFRLKIPMYGLAKFFNAWRTARDMAEAAKAGRGPGDPFEIVSAYSCTDTPRTGVAQNGLITVQVSTTENMPLTFSLTREQAIGLSAALGFEAQNNQAPKPGH